MARYEVSSLQYGENYLDGCLSNNVVRPYIREMGCRLLPTQYLDPVNDGAATDSIPPATYNKDFSWQLMIQLQTQH